MRVLLDTHVLLWVIGDPSRLSRSAEDVLADVGTEVLVSAVTAWELATKHRIGKLPEAEPILEAYDVQLRELRAQELPVSARHALLGGGMTWAHQDPFDRLLAAQAVLESVPLVTRDPAFGEVPGVRVLW